MKITLLMKAQHLGAVTPLGIVRRNPQVPHTAREVTCHPAMKGELIIAYFLRLRIIHRVQDQMSSTKVSQLW